MKLPKSLILQCPRKRLLRKMREMRWRLTKWPRRRVLSRQWKIDLPAFGRAMVRTSLLRLTGYVPTDLLRHQRMDRVCGRHHLLYSALPRLSTTRQPTPSMWLREVRCSPISQKREQYVFGIGGRVRRCTHIIPPCPPGRPKFAGNAS